jgi:hypothetical protein
LNLASRSASLLARSASHTKVCSLLRASSFLDRGAIFGA